MPNYNKVMLMGNLTRDVELKHTTSNTAVANLGMAVNRRYKVNDEMREETTFVDCEAWGRTAENLNKFFSKGRPIFIEGRLKLDEWQDRDGNKRSKLRVVVENFEFVDSGGRGGTADQPAESKPLSPLMTYPSSRAHRAPGGTGVDSVPGRLLT